MQPKHAGYYDSVNTTLLEALPTEAACLLEIGCGSGNLGAAFRARAPHCRYLGVELQPEAAALAAERLDRVWCGAAESVDLGELAGRVDCVVYGDVLEHLVDPWAELRARKSLLRAGGCVVASIPNVQNWALLQNLLNGHWHYMDHGILDETHLRFFTLSGVVEMFAAVDMQLESAIGMTPNPLAAAVFYNKIEPALDALGVDKQRFQQQIGPLQFIVRAVPLPG